MLCLDEYFTRNKVINIISLIIFLIAAIIARISDNYSISESNHMELNNMDR